MALVQWKQINPELNGNGQLTGSLEVSGSFILNGQELDLSGGVVSSNQSLSLDGYELSISNGNTITLPQGGGSADTGSLITSASAVENVITFTFGDGSTQSVTIDTGSAGSPTDITSLNTFTSSYYTDSASFQARIDTLEASTDNTGSDSQTLSIVGDQLTISEGNTVTIPTSNGVATDISALNAFTASYYNDSASIDQRFLNITSSAIDTSSLLTTASYELDSASFDSRLSNIAIDTSSLLTTASYELDSASFDSRLSAISAGDTSYDGDRIVSNEDLGDLYINSFNAGTTGSIQDFLNAVFFPNTPPSFDTPPNVDVVEFATSGSTLDTLAATDSEGQAVTFALASSYTDGYVAVSSNGVVTLAVVPTEVSFNTVDRGDGTLAHPVDIEVTDSFGSKTTQTFYFAVNVNTAPKFRQTSVGGTVITSFTANRNENATTGLVSRIYFTDDEGDAITITSASDPNGHFTLTKYPTYVQIDQVTGSLDYENITSYTMSITASDEHYPAQDADSITTLPITINVTDNLQPTINNQTLNSINEDSSTGATVDTIAASDNEGDTRTFFDFTLSKLELDNVDVPIGTYGGSSQASDPTENPFTMNSSGVVTRKAGVYLNSDIINEYQYNVKVKDSFNTASNSATITIPIADDPAPFIFDNWSGGPYVIESATTGDQIKTNSNGYSGNQARVTSNETVTWSTNSSLIQISGTGYLTMNTNVSGSYTSGQTFQADITASNTFGTQNNTLVTFTVTENLAPVVTITDLGLDSDVAISGSNIGSVSITDQETNTPYSVSLTGTDAASFNLVSNNAANSSLNIQPLSSLSAGTYSITASAEDTFGKIGSSSLDIVVSTAADYGLVYVYTSTYGSDAGFASNYNAVMGASTLNSDVPPQVTAFTANSSSPYYKLTTGDIGSSTINLAGGGVATLRASGSGAELDQVLSSIGSISASTTGQVLVIYPSGSDMTVPTSIQESFNSQAGGAVPVMNVDGNGFGIESGVLHSLESYTSHLGYDEWFVFGRKSQNAVASSFIIRLINASGSLPS